MADYITAKKLPKWREENAPPVCPLFGHGDYIRVVDHDHQTGNIRGVVSSEGNALLGKIENYYKSRGSCATWDLPTVLRAMADYLEQEEQGPLHPVGARQLARRFGRKNKTDQERMLLLAGAKQEDFEDCKNSAERTKVYRKLITG
jgi:hypothetical protein